MENFTINHDRRAQELFAKISRKFNDRKVRSELTEDEKIQIADLRSEFQLVDRSIERRLAIATSLKSLHDTVSDRMSALFSMVDPGETY